MPAMAEHTRRRLLACLLLLVGTSGGAAEERGPDEDFLLYLAAWDDAMQLELVEAAQPRVRAPEDGSELGNENEEDDDA